MSDKHKHTRKVILRKLSPKTLIEPRDPIICIRGALTIRNPVEEVPVGCTLVPHPFHLLAAWLKVTEVLLTDARLFVDFDGAAVGVGCQGLDDTSGGLTGSCVGRGDDLDGVFGTEELEEAVTSFEGLEEISGVKVGLKWGAWEVRTWRLPSLVSFTRWSGTVW